VGDGLQQKLFAQPVAHHDEPRVGGSGRVGGPLDHLERLPADVGHEDEEDLGLRLLVRPQQPHPVAPREVRGRPLSGDRIARQHRELDRLGPLHGVRTCHVDAEGPDSPLAARMPRGRNDRLAMRQSRLR
jgi:hypothetical protein